MLQKHGMV